VSKPRIYRYSRRSPTRTPRPTPAVSACTFNGKRGSA
jgi:hypothetical protein